MNTASDEMAKGEMAKYKTVKKSSTETIFLRENKNNLTASTTFINRARPKFLDK